MSELNLDNAHLSQNDDGRKLTKNYTDGVMTITPDRKIVIKDTGGTMCAVYYADGTIYHGEVDDNYCPKTTISLPNPDNYRYYPSLFSPGGDIRIGKIDSISFSDTADGVFRYTKDGVFKEKKVNNNEFEGIGFEKMINVMGRSYEYYFSIYRTFKKELLKKRDQVLKNYDNIDFIKRQNEINNKIGEIDEGVRAEENFIQHYHKFVGETLHFDRNCCNIADAMSFVMNPVLKYLLRKSGIRPKISLKVKDGNGKEHYEYFEIPENPSDPDPTNGMLTILSACVNTLKAFWKEADAIVAEETGINGKQFADYRDPTKARKRDKQGHYKNKLINYLALLQYYSSALDERYSFGQIGTNHQQLNRYLMQAFGLSVDTKTLQRNEIEAFLRDSSKKDSSFIFNYHFNIPYPTRNEAGNRRKYLAGHSVYVYRKDDTFYVYDPYNTSYGVSDGGLKKPIAGFLGSKVVGKEQSWVQGFTRQDFMEKYANEILDPQLSVIEFSNKVSVAHFDGGCEVKKIKKDSLKIPLNKNLMQNNNNRPGGDHANIAEKYKDIINWDIVPENCIPKIIIGADGSLLNKLFKHLFKNKDKSKNDKATLLEICEAETFLFCNSDSAISKKKTLFKDNPEAFFHICKTEPVKVSCVNDIMGNTFAKLVNNEPIDDLDKKCYELFTEQIWKEKISIVTIGEYCMFFSMEEYENATEEEKKVVNERNKNKLREMLALHRKNPESTIDSIYSFTNGNGGYAQSFPLECENIVSIYNSNIGTNTSNTLVKIGKNNARLANLVIDVVKEDEFKDILVKHNDKIDVLVVCACYGSTNATTILNGISGRKDIEQLNVMFYDDSVPGHLARVANIFNTRVDKDKIVSSLSEVKNKGNINLFVNEREDNVHSAAASRHIVGEAKKMGFGGARGKDNSFDPVSKTFEYKQPFTRGGIRRFGDYDDFVVEFDEKGELIFAGYKKRVDNVTVIDKTKPFFKRKVVKRSADVMTKFDVVFDGKNICYRKLGESEISIVERQKIIGDNFSSILKAIIDGTEGAIGDGKDFSFSKDGSISCTSYGEKISVQRYEGVKDNVLKFTDERKSCSFLLKGDINKEIDKVEVVDNFYKIADNGNVIETGKLPPEKVNTYLENYKECVKKKRNALKFYDRLKKTTFDSLQKDPKSISWLYDYLHNKKSMKDIEEEEAKETAIRAGNVDANDSKMQQTGGGSNVENSKKRKSKKTNEKKVKIHKKDTQDAIDEYSSKHDKYSQLFPDANNTVIDDKTQINARNVDTLRRLSDVNEMKKKSSTSNKKQSSKTKIKSSADGNNQINANNRVDIVIPNTKTEKEVFKTGSTEHGNNEGELTNFANFGTATASGTVGVLGATCVIKMDPKLYTVFILLAVISLAIATKNSIDNTNIHKNVANERPRINTKQTKNTRETVR